MNWLKSVHFVFAEILSPENLVKIRDQLCDLLTISDVELMYLKMNPKQKRLDTPFTTVPEVLFHVLYMWHSKNSSSTKRHLALLLHECKLYKAALELDPKCL